MLCQYCSVSMGALPSPVPFCEVFMHRSAFSGRRLLAVAATAALGVTVAGVAGAHLASAATAGCSVTYHVSSEWPGGFTADVSITNLGDPLTSWRLNWGFTAGQTITQLWNGSV